MFVCDIITHEVNADLADYSWLNLLAQCEFCQAN